MFDGLARLFLGRSASDAPLLTPDLAGLAAPGRPPDWFQRGAEKCRSNNAQEAFVEPFFNHVAVDTHLKRAA